MDEDLERKIGYLHMLLGLLAGVVSGVMKQNGGITGLIIAYSGFFLTKSIFGLDKDRFTIGNWISKGAMPFLMIWLPVWIFIYNI